MEKYLISEAFNQLKLNESTTLVDKLKVANDSDTSPDILSELSNNEKPDVRRAVARNSSTPSEVLNLLAGDSVDLVRYSVAKNPNTPLEVLKKLADDEEEYIREFVRNRIPYEANENEFGFTDDDFEDY